VISKQPAKLSLTVLLGAAWLGTGDSAQQPAGRLWVDASSGQAAEDGSAAFPFRSITKALDAARPGDIIRVKAGEYRENITLGDGLTLAGEGLPVLRAADAGKPAVILRGRTVLKSFRITGGEDGIIVDVNTNAQILNCEIVDNTDDGIGFERVAKPGDTPATVHIRNCLVSGNRDGIDLEGTRGAIRRCRLLKNRDDGLDYDGDTDCNALDNEIRDNRDDGIEIRLERRTLARIEGNLITGNGEDGIEIINTPVSEATANRVRIVRNTIRENARYGIGGVDQTTEEVKEGLLIRGVLLAGNVVEGNGKGQVAGVFGR
jgi:nitrous oxidase accessory protein NosD